MSRTFEDVYFSTADSVRLNAWFFPADAGSPRSDLAILICHGNGGNVSGTSASAIDGSTAGGRAYSRADVTGGTGGRGSGTGQSSGNGGTVSGTTAYGRGQSVRVLVDQTGGTHEANENTWW